MMWVRWTLPRLRIDQVMITCLKYCTPIAAVMFVGATLWTYFLPGGLFIPQQTRYGSVREGWHLEAQRLPSDEPAPENPLDSVARLNSPRSR
jgi:NADH-quinone oxidoreductase subunit H